MIRRALERGKTSGRVDDNEEVIKKRLVSNLAEIDYIVEYYRNNTKLIDVDSEPTPSKVFESILPLFGKEE